MADGSGTEASPTLCTRGTTGHRAKDPACRAAITSAISPCHMGSLTEDQQAASP